MARRYLIRASTGFSAAHVLHGYAGGCERVHGHNFVVEAEVEAHDLDEVGMGFDFLELRRALAAICEGLDHRLLNELEPFERTNPTAENIAAFVHQRLLRMLPSLPRGERVRLRAVTVRETPDSAVVYTED